jgi:hypothetical protein
MDLLQDHLATRICSVEIDSGNSERHSEGSESYEV